MIVEFLIMMIKSPSSPFSWCETLQECVRVWETYCESLETGH